MIRRNFILSRNANHHVCDACRCKGFEILPLSCGCRYPSRHTSIVKCERHGGVLKKLPYGYSGLDKAEWND